jgi:phage tail sheath protein FI
MPGVVIETGAISGPTAPGRAPASTYFLVGQAQRGPVDKPVLVRSLAEFIRVFGEAASYAGLFYEAKTFFAEGGTRAYVARVVGDAATLGNLSAPLSDRAVTPGNSLSVKAASPGAWSSAVSVEVLDGNTTDTFRIRVLVGGKVVEDYGALKSPDAAVARINSGIDASRYIRVTPGGSTATAPQNNPKAAAPVSLTAGTDDRASIVAATYVEALGLFDEGMGDGAVAIPGLGSTVHDELIEHATRFNRIALLSSERGSDKGTLLGQAAALDSPRAGLFAPWVSITDVGGGTRQISPESYVAAARARAHEAAGPWRAGAGELSQARSVTGPDQIFTPDDANDLDAGKVNVIRSIGATTRVYGWRSLASDQANWKMLSAADIVNRIVTECKRVLEPYVFAPIDSKGHLLSAMAGTLEGVVQPMAMAGGLFARMEEQNGQLVEIDPGYRVVTGAELNSSATLANDEIRGQLAVRPAPSAALVMLTVNKASVTAAL